MKKLLCSIIAAAVLLSALVIPAGAAKTNEPTTEELEAVIKLVRSKIDVPEDYTEFSWNYRSPSYYSKSGWYLSWEAKDYSGSINVSCDSKGNISSFDSYSRNTSYNAALPEKSPEKYLDKVEAFIYKAAPYLEGKIELTDVSAQGLRSHSYAYSFERYENGVCVPDNNVSAVFDYVSESVTSFDISFDDGLDFKAPENLIGEQKAKEILNTAQSMKLSYRLKTEYDEQNGGVKSRRAYLVYTPELSYVSVDAFTGEVYTERNTWEINDTGANKHFSSASGSMAADTAESAADEEAGNYKLSESELAQLEVLEGLITREEAINSVTSNKYLYIDSEASAVEAYLRKNYSYGFKASSDDDQNYVWNIEFSKPYDDESSFYSHMSATVDAATGKLLSFNASVPDYWQYEQDGAEIPALKFTKDRAAEISAEFLKNTEPEKFACSRPGEPYESIVLYYETAKNDDGSDGEQIPVFRACDCNYIRTNEGVDFNYNGIYTSVDLVTGKILSFSTNWYDDVEFESVKDILTLEQALSAYLENDGFGENYEINSTYTYNKYLADKNDGKITDSDELYQTSLSTRLVYSAYDMGTNIVRASDGKLISYSGEEYKKLSKFEYSDIDGHWACELIKRFAYAKIGFEGNEFKPDIAITPEEFTTLLNKCGIYGYRITDTASDVSADTMTRADAVKQIISYLGFDSVARLENVFITDFADNTALKKDDVGYIAIARGFGIVEGDGQSFRPYDALTRAEALQLCFRVTKAQIER